MISNVKACLKLVNPAQGLAYTFPPFILLGPPTRFLPALSSDPVETSGIRGLAWGGGEKGGVGNLATRHFTRSTLYLKFS